MVGVTISVVISLSLLLFTTHKSVVISSEHWVCTSVDTVGIEARCIEYGYVHGPKMANEP